METDIFAVDKVVASISGRKDINDLYEKKGSIIQSYFDKGNNYFNLYNIWNDFKNQNNYSILSLYKSFINSSLSQINSFLIQHQWIFDAEKLNLTIQGELLKNTHYISNGLFKTEIRLFGGNEEEYFKEIANDFSFFTKLFDKYSYWHTLLDNFLIETTHFLLEFLELLVKDGEVIMDYFFEDFNKVDDIHLSMGDRHKGKFVIEVETETGNFFYKPRSADLDFAFEKILDKITNSAGILKMKYPKFQSFENYSWFQKVEFNSLESSNIQYFQNYYIRLGQLLAIVYILNGGDIHYENIISNGEYPVIIDSEPLLTSRLRFKKNTSSLMLQNDAVNYIEDSVRNSLILPNVFSLRGNYFEFSPFRIYDKFDPNTQEDIKKIANHKVLKSELKRVSEYVSKGFASAYQEINCNKESYLEFLTQLFKGLKVRFLNKPTDDYAKVKELLTNPVCLFDIQYAFAMSSKIINSDNGDIAEEEFVEQRELLQFNIPYFEIKTNSRDLILSSKETLKDYFTETPMDGLVHKIKLLGQEDLDRQLQIIEEMFIILSPEFKVKELNEVKPNKTLSPGDSIEESISRLIHKIFNAKMINPLTKQYFWLGPELEGNLETGLSYYRSVDYPNSYYTGSVGFLRALLMFNNSCEYDIYINKLIQDIEIDIDHFIYEKIKGINIGAYNGLAQYLRYYSMLYKTNKVKKNYFLKRVNKILNLIEENLGKDRKLDILDGTAGVTLTLIEIYNLDVTTNLNKQILRLLKLCHAHLINSIVFKNDESYLPFEQDKEKYFTGFAHGTSGMIMALHKTSKVLNLDNTAIISKLIQTERKHFNQQEKVWYKDNMDQDYSWGWCHGVPGILLSRIELFQDGYIDQYIVDEMRELYEITVNKSFGTNLTLCHGDLGNIVICKYAQNVLSLSDSRIEDYVKSHLPSLLNADQLNIRGTEAMGLMHGLMGIVTFLDAALKEDYTSLLDILKITST